MAITKKDWQRQLRSYNISITKSMGKKGYDIVISRETPNLGVSGGIQTSMLAVYKKKDRKVAFFKTKADGKKALENIYKVSSPYAFKKLL